MIQSSCRIGTAASMGKPYSQDLRERVIAAVDGDQVVSLDPIAGCRHYFSCGITPAARNVLPQ